MYVKNLLYTNNKTVIQSLFITNCEPVSITLFSSKLQKILITFIEISHLFYFYFFKLLTARVRCTNYIYCWPKLIILWKSPIYASCKKYRGSPVLTPWCTHKLIPHRGQGGCCNSSPGFLRCYISGYHGNRLSSNFTKMCLKDKWTTTEDSMG